MDRQKVLDKIKKCLALSKSPEAAEAAAALRQAQKLMELYGVSNDEIGAIGYGSERVAVPVQANIKVPAYLNELLHLMERAFGVEPIIETEVRVSDESYVIRYFGPEHRVMLAAYAHEVTFRAMMNAWTRHIKANPRRKGERGVRSGFLLGWIEAVQAAVMAIALNDEEKAGTELVKKNFYEARGTTLVTLEANQLRVSDNAWNAGSEAGSQFSLHRPMGGKENLKLDSK